MSGAADDPPQALLITAGSPSSVPPAKSMPSAASPSPSRTPAASGSAGAKPPEGPSPDPDARPGASARTPSAPQSPGASPSPAVSPPISTQSRVTEGGTVTLALGKDSANLVTATPAPGWAVQRWEEDKWIRVTFTRGSNAVSVFCTWHDHAPLITTDPA
ncbi:hypothetical protein ACODT5_01965 [Streptomyces sp. 5.8]|uniref:hypothetical protein n=1 Tax=Streptomyces sp. 5.8 TaxID=3406571 RepID=UPI003BB503AE